LVIRFQKFWRTTWNKSNDKLVVEQKEGRQEEEEEASRAHTDGERRVERANFKENLKKRKKEREEENE
jgi:hypothetical protein